MKDAILYAGLFFGTSALAFWLLTKTAKPGHEDERGFHTDYDEEGE